MAIIMFNCKIVMLPDSPRTVCTKQYSTVAFTQRYLMQILNKKPHILANIYNISV